MKRWSRWQDWVEIALGTYMMLVPLFTVDARNVASIWVAEVFGAAIVVVGLLALAHPETEWLEMTNFTVGALLSLAPWMFGYSDLGGATGNAWVVGVLTVIVSLWGDVKIRQFHGELQS